MHSIVILNGPNLNLLGMREPEIYGRDSLEDIKKLCEAAAQGFSIKADFRQTNHEGELIDWVQEAGRGANGLIINPAGLSHTSISLMDALLAINIPILEVHLSNLHKREEFRQHSYTARAAKGVICGLGAKSYLLALYAMSEIFKGNA